MTMASTTGSLRSYDSIAGWLYSLRYLMLNSIITVGHATGLAKVRRCVLCSAAVGSSTCYYYTITTTTITTTTPIHIPKGCGYVFAHSLPIYINDTSQHLFIIPISSLNGPPFIDLITCSATTSMTPSSPLFKLFLTLTLPLSMLCKWRVLASV